MSRNGSSCNRTGQAGCVRGHRLCPKMHPTHTRNRNHLWQWVSRSGQNHGGQNIHSLPQNPGFPSIHRKFPGQEEEGTSCAGWHFFIEFYVAYMQVAGHKSELVCGTLGDKYVIMMRGRFHYYEGYSPSKVCMDG